MAARPASQSKIPVEHEVRIKGEVKLSPLDKAGAGIPMLVATATGQFLVRILASGYRPRPLSRAAHSGGDDGLSLHCLQEKVLRFGALLRVQSTLARRSGGWKKPDFSRLACKWEKARWRGIKAKSRNG